MNSQPQTRRGCTCLCRNLTYQQMIELPDDHLNCLLKKDIITLCQIYDIQFKSWQAKGELIKMIIEHRNKKNVNIKGFNQKQKRYLIMYGKKNVHYFFFYF